MMKFYIQNDTDKKSVIGYIANELKDDTDYVIEIKRYKQIRSLNQNSYYWGVVVKILSDELGYFPDEIHNILKTKFLLAMSKMGDVELRLVQSTTGLDTSEFEMYLERIRIWAIADLNVTIPLPNEEENYE